MFSCVTSKVSKRIGVAALGIALSAGFARAESPETIYTMIVEQVVVPGFQNTEDAAKTHAAAWETYCLSSAPPDLIQLRETFHSVGDAWATAEMFRSGPASKDFRRDKLYLWPERKNAVARALAAVLQNPEDIKTDAEWIAQQSAAIQGLPALERLLFDDDIKPREKIDTPNCRLGQAVSKNVVAISTQLSEEWKALSKTQNLQLRTALATDIVTGIALAKDDKIENVIGRGKTPSKPKAAEFWRSARSLRNLIGNLSTYRQIADIVARAELETSNMAFAATTTLKSTSDMKEPLAAYAEASLRRDGNFLIASMDSLGDIAALEVPAALGVTIGFNSSDGD
jgi:uncharacterized protein